VADVQSQLNGVNQFKQSNSNLNQNSNLMNNQLKKNISEQSLSNKGQSEEQTNGKQFTLYTAGGEINGI
jgi:hypothetical protein